MHWIMILSCPMDNILIWNVRGLNKPHKQKEVSNFLLHQKAGMTYLLETKINDNFSSVYANMFQNWCVSTNFNKHKSGRILVAWLSQNFCVEVKYAFDQCLHLNVSR